MSMMLSYSQIT